MRKIKFRAWSPEMKQMLDWDIIKNMMAGLLLKESNANIPIQFTGEYDIGNYKIHQDDIVKHDDLIWVVVFESGSFWLRNKTRMIPLHDICTCEIEIIGNIYEHKELIS